MRITVSQLRRIIKEEVQRNLRESARMTYDDLDALAGELGAVLVEESDGEITVVGRLGRVAVGQIEEFVGTDLSVESNQQRETVVHTGLMQTGTGALIPLAEM